MPIGSVASIAESKRRGGSRHVQLFRTLYARVYGNSDLHTHIRWRAIRRAVPSNDPLVDIGCGDGLITTEVACALPGVTVHGIELDPEGVIAARQTTRDLGITNVSFKQGDVSDIEFQSAGGALLLDILEHLPDESKVIESLGRAVRPGGTVLVSTPTPNYPRFFGRRFHEAVGHVRPGYSADQIAALLEPAGFVVDDVTYYTKLPSSLVCSLYYRKLWDRRVGMLASPVLNVVSWADAVWPWTSGASSILVRASKR